MLTAPWLAGRLCAGGCGTFLTHGRGRHAGQRDWWCQERACQSRRDARKAAAYRRRRGTPVRVTVPCAHCGQAAHPVPGRERKHGVLCSRGPCLAEYDRRRKRARSESIAESARKGVTAG